MIIQNNKTISALYKGTKEIVKRYKGTQVIYEAWKELIKSGVPPITLLKCKPTNFSTGLPSPYQQVEYLEATGTQFIDMKYTYKVNDILDIDFMKTNNTNAIQGIFGNGNAQPYVGISLYVNNTNLLTTTIGGILGEDFARYNTPIENNVKYNVKIKGGTVYLNDKEIITVPNVLFNGTQADFSLFRRWGTNTMLGRIYKFSISRNDKKIFDFIPCYRKSDNVLGMYDLVNGIFYTNAGNGEFLKGKDVVTNLVDYKIYGDSEQESGISRNLFDISKAENGTISADTGNNLDTDLYPNRCRSGFIYLTAGTYVISFKELISTGSYLHRYSSANVNAWLGALPFSKSGSVSKFTLTSACYVRFTIQPINTSGDLVLNTETLKEYQPQLELGDTPTQYIPFGNYPSPDIPIEIESVGEKTANLIPYPFYYTTRTINDVTFTVNSDGSVTLNGTASADNTNFLITYTSGFQLDVGKYTINGAPEGANRTNGVYMVWQNKAFVEDSKPQNINLTKKENVYIYIVVKKGTVCNNLTFKPMIQLSTGTVKEYDRFGYKIPVKVRGKNYLDIEHLGNISNWDTAPTYASYEISLPNGNYYFNYETDLESYNGHILILNKIKSSSSSATATLINGSYNIQAKQGKFTISNNEKIYLNWYCGSKNQTNLTKLINDILNNFIIEQGDTFTGYEPYHEPITTNIYLNEPLRKIGDYADYIDFEKSKVFRNIKTKVFDGSEQLSALTGYDYPYAYYMLSTKNNVVNDTCLSSHFVLQPNFSYTNEGDNKFRIYYSPTNAQSRIAFRVVKNGKIITDTATLKAKFLEAYNSGKPCIFYYAVPKDYETSEDVSFPNIPLNKGTNIIEVDTSILPSNMEVKYIGKE